MAALLLIHPKCFTTLFTTFSGSGIPEVANQLNLWSRRPGLNGRPAVYETAALPTELRRHLGETEERLG